jgi:hypothetical protein
VLKIFGLADVLREALAPLASKVERLSSTAPSQEQDTSQSDVDLMIVSDSLGYADVFGALEPASISLGRPVNPTVYSPAQFAKRTRRDNAFITRVLEQPKIWLIGSQEGLQARTAAAFR